MIPAHRIQARDGEIQTSRARTPGLRILGNNMPMAHKAISIVLLRKTPFLWLREGVLAARIDHVLPIRRALLCALSANPYQCVPAVWGKSSDITVEGRGSNPIVSECDSPFRPRQPLAMLRNL